MKVNRKMIILLAIVCIVALWWYQTSRSDWGITWMQPPKEVLGDANLYTWVVRFEYSGEAIPPDAAATLALYVDGQFADGGSVDMNGEAAKELIVSWEPNINSENLRLTALIHSVLDTSKIFSRSVKEYIVKVS